jgi:tetratricopeptide (TPR) repeat protein
VSYLVLRQRRQRPWLLAGWLWYLGTLVPVIGLVTVGSQSHADRYTYIPLVGIFIAIVWLADDLLPRRTLLRAGEAATLLAVFSAVTWRQTGCWRDGITLNERALAVTRDNFIAENNLGLALERSGDLAGAHRHYRAAVAIAPGFHKAAVNLAVTEGRTGRVPEGLALVNEVLGDRPDDPHALDCRGVLLLLADRPSEALATFRQLLILDPVSVDTLRKAATASIRSGDHEAAGDYLSRALAIDPTDIQSLNQAASLQLLAGRPAAAAPLLRRSLVIDPEQADGQYNLGLALLETGDPAGAVNHLRHAVRLKPGAADYRFHLVRALARSGQRAEAAAAYAELVRLDPDGAAGMLSRRGAAELAGADHERSRR